VTRPGAADYPVHVEVATFYTSRGVRSFARWNDVGTFPTRAAAWAWLTGQGYTAADKGDSFLATAVLS
jgi:hypothetical protein